MASASVNFQRFFETLDNKIEKNVQKHLKDVYGTLALSLLVAAIGSYVHVATDLLQGSFLTSLGALGLLILLMATPHTKENESYRLGYLFGFAGLTGLGIGPLLDVVIDINPSIIATAFMGSCVIFGCFTLAALYAPDTKFLYLGGMLMSALSTLFWVTLVGIFAGSYAILQANLYIGFLVMCGFILYDTQMIMEKRRRGDTDYIWHSVELFIDFVSIFRRLLVILAQKEDRKKRN
jgi:FtsH-binding integral membrane protein